MGRSYSLPDKIENGRRGFQENVMSGERDTPQTRVSLCTCRTGLTIVYDYKIFSDAFNVMYINLLIFILRSIKIYIEKIPKTSTLILKSYKAILKFEPS